MTPVLICGMAVVDFLFLVDALPRTAEKYRARDASVVGGGGAANAAVAVSRLGGQAHLVARIGDDGIGRLVLADLLAEGVDCNYVQVVGGGRTSFSNVLVDGAGERQVVNFRGDGFSDMADWVSSLRLPFFAALADTRWTEGAAALMDLAAERKVPGIIDGEAPVDPACVERATHVVFSAQCLRDFTGCDDPVEGLQAARKRTGAWLAVTVGAGGTHFTDGAKLRHQPAFDVPVVDTLAAGDVWHGAFALALGEGMEEAEAVRLASAVAALKCTRPGGRRGTPTRLDAETFLKRMG